MTRIAKSEIEELFNIEAEERGLLPKEATKAENPAEMKKYINSYNPRMGLDADEIADLYDVKPNGTEYEYNIMEIAHPGNLIIAPSYDRLNGLVETENERQTIILNQVLRPTTGIAENTKFAKRDLIGELVRVANFLDNRDEEELAIEVDAILEKLK